MKKQVLTAAAVVVALSVQALPVFAREIGDYDSHHRWRDVEWWHMHHPKWMYEHHPEWAESHPDWRSEGDFDEHRQWHARDWWIRNHRDWVREHHANWSD